MCDVIFTCNFWEFYRSFIPRLISVYYMNSRHPGINGNRDIHQFPLPTWDKYKTSTSVSSNTEIRVKPHPFIFLPRLAFHGEVFSGVKIRNQRCIRGHTGSKKRRFWGHLIKAIQGHEINAKIELLVYCVLTRARKGYFYNTTDRGLFFATAPSELREYWSDLQNSNGVR